MSKLLSFVFGISFIGIAAARATPFHSEHARFIIPVASGCGIGVHRGAYDGCEPIYGGYHRSFYRGYNDGYYDGYYDGPGRSLLLDQGGCSGRGNYLVCNAYDVCWAACYGLNGMPAD